MLDDHISRSSSHSHSLAHQDAHAEAAERGSRPRAPAGFILWEAYLIITQFHALREVGEPCYFPRTAWEENEYDEGEMRSFRGQEHGQEYDNSFDEDVDE